jgi:hypothetical protein
MELGELDFAESAPTMALDPRDPELTDPIDAALDWGV